MCIISIKLDTARKWTFTEIADMMEKNPDGAGFMYFDKLAKNVKIEKGFFSPNKAFNYLKKLPDDVPIIFHARIATHGKVSQGNCHPFPLYTCDESKYIDESDILKPRQNVSVGLAHNGILKVTPRGNLSDTGTFCEYINHHFDIAQLPYLVDILQGSDILNSSRLAILDSNGKVYKLGTWYEHDGLFYSNYSYPGRVYNYNYPWHNRPSKSNLKSYLDDDDVYWNEYPLMYNGYFND